MDKDYLSKKRNKPDPPDKPSNFQNNPFNKVNPFFDFCEDVTIQEKLNSNNKYHSRQHDYNNQRNSDNQPYHNFNNAKDSRNMNSYYRNNDPKNSNYKGKFDKGGNYGQNPRADVYSNNKKEYSHKERENPVENSSNNKKRLPIERYRDVILNYIKNNQVLVIAGETGCGKTTQVPKYIFEDYEKRNDNSLNMIITQPRRIAAVSIAKRLSEELGVTTGKEVGYHVGRSPVFDSERTKILIVTTGIFLQRLIHEKELPNVSHVVLDEVHERDIDIDFVMILIKHILKKHPNLKLILMSATISTHLFANYFSKDNIEKIDDLDYYRNVSIKQIKEVPKQDLSWDNLPEEQTVKEKSNDLWEITTGDWAYVAPRNNHSSNKTSKKLEERNESLFMNENESNRAPIIKIDEKIYPVKIEYLKEIIEKYVDREFARRLPAEFQFEKIAPRIADYIFDIAAMLIRMIHTDDRAKNFYSILVFLPGFFEIQSMNEKILSIIDREEQEIEILQLHSGISDEEQSQVFLKKNKRKIILSTNIAESSITIPDIYYVIDFCLCKELKCNIKNNHQTLELNWASKASCNQRAGRAGRVSNGFVYRLIYKDFFDYDLSDFSSPELIRTPLEKLILKIKVWDCGEPEKILGRAIEPPNIKHIYAAIENLQNYGALTIPNDKSKTGELTELGKVYSELPIDIKYSRFIMLSFCFDIVEPAIIVCSILTQDKTIFRNKKTSMEVSIILKKHYEIRKTYDCGLNNDFVVFYNAYKAWSKNFGNEEGNSEFTRRYNKRVSDYEKRWCSENDLDFKVTREVRIVIADLKLRLKKLNVYSDNINKSFDFAKDKEALFYFNIVVAGAFYGNIIKCGFYNYEKIQKLSKFKEYNPLHTISIKCVVSSISDNQIQDFFRKFGKISYFKRYGEEVIISFAKDNYIDSIKKVLLCGGYKYSASEFVIDYKHEHLEKMIPFQLKRPEYLYQLKFFDLFSQNHVEIDPASVNHVLLPESEKSLSTYFLTTEHYHTKKQKFHSKLTAKLPEIPMLDYLIMIVFSPYVKFYSDENNRQYHMFRILGSELEFRFTHLFSSVDVEEINYIRSLMNNIIKDVYDETKILSQRKALKERINILMNKKRAKLISKGEWWDLLYKYYPNLDKGINMANDRWEIETNDQKNEHTFKEKENNDFLPQIRKLEGLKDHRLFVEDGRLEIEEERRCFIEMREKIMNYYEDMKNIINLTETEVICKTCGSYICMAKNLNCVAEKNEFHEITGYIGNFIQISDFNDEISRKDIFCKNILNEYDYNSDVSWISCSKKHVIGLYMKEKYYVTNNSFLMLKFPMLRIDDWKPVFYQDKYKRLKIYEEECLKERKRNIQNLYCDLCNINRFKDPNEFINHIEKNQTHKQIMTELMEEEF